VIESFRVLLYKPATVISLSHHVTSLGP